MSNERVETYRFHFLHLAFLFFITSLLFNLFVLATKTKLLKPSVTNFWFTRIGRQMDEN